MKQIVISQGLDLGLVGSPDQSQIPEKKEVSLVALCGADYVGMKPTILVEEGEAVLAGQPLFEDKKNPGVKFVSPGAGVVKAIIRGEKRAFRSIMIDLASDSRKSVFFESYASSALLDLCPTKVRDLLVRSGLWTAFRTRPFSRVPRIDSAPASLFVNAADTNPCAPDPLPIIIAKKDAFLDGLRVLSRICGKKLRVCFGKGDYASDFIADVERIPNLEAYQFLGKHPSGLTGTHIAKLDPCGLGKVVWSIGYQDVIAIGELFVSGVYPTERVISFAGPMVKKPRLLSVQRGACLKELTKDELKDGSSRIISGSVLCGRAVEEGICALGAYVNQVSVIGDGDPRELFAWTLPCFNKFSAARTVGSTYLFKKAFNMTTALGGGRRAVFPNPIFDKLSPIDIVPTFLFKALEIGDIDRCERLGAFELDEEDLALFTLVDFGKNDYGKTLRALLDKAMIEEE